jgi:hypothetical protein
MLAESMPTAKHLAMILEAVENCPSPSTIRTHQPIGHVDATLLEWLLTFGAIDGLEFHGERDVISPLREDLVEPSCDTAEERRPAIQSGQERRIPASPDISLNGSRDVDPEVAPRTEPRAETVVDGQILQQ